MEVLENAVVQGKRPKNEYILSDMKGHLEYPGQKELERMLPCDSDAWRNWKSPPDAKLKKF